MLAFALALRWLPKSPSTTGSLRGEIDFVGIMLLGVVVLAGHAPAGAAGWFFAAPLLIIGIGGGMVISPNTTLTLECVPTSMAGVAGGALQTGQWIGTAIGTVVLASVFHAVLASDGGYPSALTAAMLCAAGLTCSALLLSVIELRARQNRRLLIEREQAAQAAADSQRG